MRVMLPTMEIIREHRHYDYLFDFYEDGIYGIVRDAIVSFDNTCKRLDYLDDDRFVKHALLHYQNSYDAVCNSVMENTDSSHHMEILISCVIIEVREMIRRLYLYRPIQFTKQHCTWCGDDIVINLL